MHIESYDIIYLFGGRLPSSYPKSGWEVVSQNKEQANLQKIAAILICLSQLLNGESLVCISLSTHFQNKSEANKEVGSS
jgi:hypothetical protein